MNIGITTRSFTGLTNEEAARMIAEIGYKCTELCLVQNDSNYWRYNGRTDLSDMTLDRFLGIVESYRKQSVDVSALGVFTNLIEKEPEARKANLDYFAKHMELASHAGIKCLSTECGFDPHSRGVQAHRYESDFNLLKESVSYLADLAEKFGEYVAIEPCVLDVIPSAKRMRDFIEQIGSDRVKVLLDPANLIANSSEEDMFRYLKDHIFYFHGKDRKVNDTYGRLIGDGDIDWPLFLSLYHNYTEGFPFIIEYPNKDTAGMTYERVMRFNEESLKLMNR